MKNKNRFKNLTIFGISFILITSGCSLKINKDQNKFYKDVNKYISEFTDDDYLVCAHRGYSSKEIENTHNSFKRANNSDYVDYIEMDVRMTKDKKFVLSHDEKLYNIDHFIRVSELDKDILLNGDYTYTDLAMISGKDGKFKRKKNKLYNEKFNLIDMLEGINTSKDKKILLDLKFEDNGYDFIVNFIKEINKIDTSNIIIQSKNLDYLKILKYIRNDLNYSAIIDDYSDYDKIDEFDSITVKEKYINNPIVKDRIKDNKKVFVWTINSSKSFYEVADYLGKDFDKVVYVTDYPNEISYLLNDYNKSLKKTMK